MMIFQPPGGTICRAGRGGNNYGEGRCGEAGLGVARSGKVWLGFRKGAAMGAKFVKLSDDVILNVDEIQMIRRHGAGGNVWLRYLMHSVMLTESEYAGLMQLVDWGLQSEPHQEAEQQPKGSDQSFADLAASLGRESMGFKHLQPGLYRIYWKSGGHSLASVGILHDGSRWYAPCNWTSDPRMKVVCDNDWSFVERVQRIELPEGD